MSSIRAAMALKSALTAPISSRERMGTRAENWPEAMRREARLSRSRGAVSTREMV